MKKIFINLTNHELTKDQLDYLKSKNFEIINREEIFIHKILEVMRNSPDNSKDITYYTNIIKSILQIYLEEHFTNDTHIWVHLPVGSPAFNSLLHIALCNIIENFPNFKLVYSHSKRIIEEIKNEDSSVTKVTRFKFEKFIVF